MNFKSRQDNKEDPALRKELVSQNNTNMLERN